MAGKRNCIIELITYLKNCGIDVNIAKNKARGNKGFFRVRGDFYRIDISKNVDEDAVLRTLVHEFTHFVHFKYDKTLKNLDFIFDENNPVYEEELLNLTVDSIDKNSVTPLFDMKNKYQRAVDFHYNNLRTFYPEIKKNEPYKRIESLIKGDLRYLLKYDRVKVLDKCTDKIYSIENLSKDFSGVDDKIKDYIMLRFNQRHLKRVNSRISRLNRYYNTPTELFARSFEYYVCNPNRMLKNAPNLYKLYKNVILENKIPMLAEMIKIVELNNC